MKIHIKNNKSEFKFWLPTSFLKSKYLLKKIKKDSTVDLEALMNSLPIIYKSLKYYIKKNGHFVLIDIESSDGTTIFIYV